MFQLFDNRTCTYTYLLADAESKEAVLIDPVYELVDRDVHLLRDLDLNLLYGGQCGLFPVSVSDNPLNKKGIISNRCPLLLYRIVQI